VVTNTFAAVGRGRTSDNSTKRGIGRNMQPNSKRQYEKVANAGEDCLQSSNLSSAKCDVEDAADFRSVGSDGVSTSVEPKAGVAAARIIQTASSCPLLQQIDGTSLAVGKTSAAIFSTQSEACVPDSSVFSSLNLSDAGRGKSVSSSSTSDDNGSYHDAECDENILHSAEKVRVERRPLLPSGFASVQEALQQFVLVFESRYGGNHPVFHMGTLQDAIRDAFYAPGHAVCARRPLAVYVHNDNAIACNIFAKNVLCSDKISSLLNAEFVLWSWDVTIAENRDAFMKWTEACRVQGLKNRMKKILSEHYPLLIVLIRKNGVVHCTGIAFGYESIDQVFAKLGSGLAEYSQIKVVEADEEKGRAEREELRRQQERDYELSRAQDRVRCQQLQKQKQNHEREEVQKREDEAVRHAEEEEKERRNKQLASSLPAEPAAAERSVVTVRIRFPDASAVVRRFRTNEPLRNLATFIELKGYSLDRHRILTSDVPRKDMIQSYDLSDTFEKLKWLPREQVIVDEK
uniref:UBX domain-containing protein n=1 Tax=Parascaris univalens TaxID=6257 RepID=A0A915A1W2_PARUN